MSIAARLKDDPPFEPAGKIGEEVDLVSLGDRDPDSGRVVLSPSRTLPTAIAYVRDHHHNEDGRTLQVYAEQPYRWTGSHYVQVEDAEIKRELHNWLHEALRYVPKRNGDQVLSPFNANPSTVKAALETIKAHAHIPSSISPPVWLDGPEESPAHEILPCPSGLLHLPTGKRISATPRLFVTYAIEFDPDPNALQPMAWFNFLHQIFEGDEESQQLLQEWFGYCLIAATWLQKMLLMVGPRRSGKGTVARVLARLIGTANVCGPTTESLARQFGLQPLIGKPLAIVSDARFHGESIATVVERLLCISGEDSISIDRKFLPSVTLKLPTRFMFLTNELPRLHDSSGALAGRFVVLRLTRSFYGEEDTGLTETLLAELPGILNWAIEGWHRLRERGHFVMPQSVQDAVQDMEDLGSPVGAFVREQCIAEPGQRIFVPALYEAWRLWCMRDGRTTITTVQTFGKDLAAAVPGVRVRRGSDNQRFYDGISLREAF
ncbi:MAG: DUF5906 domain-containing protein [Planctomycetia bacterium]|nr:DUF5906 domain-containing protein [Planctomycetia bacterium]